MTRVDKIRLLQQVAAGRGSIEDLEPVPLFFIIMYNEESGLYDCGGMPKSWGYPDSMTMQQVKALKERIEQYCQCREVLGLPEPIVVIGCPPGSENELISD